MTFKTSVVYKVTQEQKGKNLEMGYLYFKGVPVTFAQVLKPGKKYQSEDTAYQLNLFIDKETAEATEAIGLNKELAEVGVTKIKKGANRGELKYKLDEHNTPYVGMFAAQFSRNTVKRDKEGVIQKTLEPLKLIGPDGKPFTEEVGNGSICDVKMFAYRNADNMLVVMLDTVVVREHVAYSRDGDYYDEELGITIKASAKAEPKAEATPTTSQPDPEDFSDDIPF